MRTWAEPAAAVRRQPPVAAKKPAPTSLPVNTPVPGELQRGFAGDFARVRVHSNDHGDPLPNAARARVQAQLGHDFSGVRVHSGPEAHQAARAVAAVAFTVGDDIYLGADADRPGSANGNRLLMHELA